MSFFFIRAHQPYFFKIRGWSCYTPPPMDKRHCRTVYRIALHEQISIDINYNLSDWSINIINTIKIDKYSNRLLYLGQGHYSTMVSAVASWASRSARFICCSANEQKIMFMHTDKFWIFFNGAFHLDNLHYLKPLLECALNPVDNYWYVISR